jgi:betaine-aldehyde dehydrogenase
VLGYVEVGVAEGAELLLGGGCRSDPALASGNYVGPTVFTQVKPTMRIAREEIFGPVLSVAAYSSVDEVVELANDSSFGLAAAIWTRDLEVARRVSRDLRVGMVWINEFLAMFPEAPHGGYGLSGIGREMGSEALHGFLENTTVIEKTGRREPVSARQRLVARPRAPADDPRRAPARPSRRHRSRLRCAEA